MIHRREFQTPLSTLNENCHAQSPLDGIAVGDLPGGACAPFCVPRNPLPSQPLPLPLRKKRTRRTRSCAFSATPRATPLPCKRRSCAYVPADDERKGLTVDLVGAVHIADKSYYNELNKAFAKYEALLFELVAPEGTKIPQGGARDRGFNPVSGMQRGMQSMLDLEFQLDCIDYTKENFVHADMSPDEFAKSMKDRKESMLQMIFRAMGQGAAQQGKGSDAELLMALFAKDRPFRLKRAMASQFENLEGQMAVLEGKDGSTIITERNKKRSKCSNARLRAAKRTWVSSMAPATWPTCSSDCCPISA